MKREPVGEGIDVQEPEDLHRALIAAPLAETVWRELTPLARRDYIGWINEAKQVETRHRRIERCCENLIKGKKRPCCYAVVPMDLYKALGESPAAKAHWSSFTGAEKRDFSDWIEASGDRETRKRRVEEACLKLIAGQRCP